MIKKIISLLLTVCILIGTLCGCLDTALDIADSILSESGEETTLPEEDQVPQEEVKEESNQSQAPPKSITVEEDGEYTSKDDVALYISTYNHLPSNYITKKEAEELGWQSNKGNLWAVTEGKSIGGDKFGNREGLLPSENGRKWFECDIDFDGSYRNAKRIVYSSDGLIYYTEDHYKTFTKLNV